MTLIVLVPGKIYLIHSRACCWLLILNGWPKCFLTKIKHQFVAKFFILKTRPCDLSYAMSH